MSIRINLLPWREELRKERQQQFLIMLGASAFLGFGLMISVHLYFEAAIAHQNERNSRLEHEIEIFKKQIAEIKVLSDEKDKLKSKMDIIQQLQDARPLIVYLFDELAMSVVDGIILERITQKGSTQTTSEITIEGIAQSNQRISEYMRHLSQSKWLKDPVLEYSSAQGDKPDQPIGFSFRLKVTLQAQIKKASEEGEEKTTTDPAKP